jgi:UDP-3-O-[3-hydroxymyristoyl] glucosamine N-acyltransferase
MKIDSDFSSVVKVVEGRSTLDHSFFIKDVRSLEAATDQDIAFLFDPEDNSVFPPLAKEKIEKSKAGAIVASRPWVEGKEYILVDDPVGALKKIALFAKHSYPTIEGKVNIHPSATIAEDAKVSESAIVGPNVTIESGSVIGERSVIGANSYIDRNVKIGSDIILYPSVTVLFGSVIGDHSILHAGVVIGSDGFGYRVMKTGLRKEPQVGIVRIGSHVEIGANTCIDRATFEETVIDDGVKIDNHVQIAHNVHIGKSTAILALTGIAGGVEIGIGCQIGGLVAIRDHVKIGNGVKIVSKSAVMSNIKDGETVAGIPSMPFGKWKRLVVILLKLSEVGKDLFAFYSDSKKGEKKISLWQKCKRIWSLIRR